jgi:hypothetical protein
MGKQMTVENDQYPKPPYSEPQMEPQTSEQIEQHIARLQKKLGPPVQTEAEKKQIQAEIDTYQKRLNERRHFEARELVGTEARNRGADPNKAMQEFDRTHARPKKPNYQPNRNVPYTPTYPSKATPPNPADPLAPKGRDDEGNPRR